MKWSPRDYDRACRDYAARQAATDETLYRLCRRYPDHQSMNSVFAKVSIIGRAYATGIERMVPTTGSQSSSITQVAEHFVRHGRQLESIFRRLAKIAEPLKPDKLQRILTEHARIGKLVQPILRQGRSSRSFVSKYMHFHCPAVPIFDGVVVRGINRFYRWSPRLVTFAAPPGVDPKYLRYVCRFWHLYRRARQDRPGLKVKLLDRYLLLAGETDARKGAAV